MNAGTSNKHRDPETPGAFLLDWTYLNPAFIWCPVFNRDGTVQRARSSRYDFAKQYTDK